MYTTAQQSANPPAQLSAHPPDITNSNPDYNMFADLATLLARQQIAPTRISNFDDTPASYYSWKTSFNAVCTELRMPPGERVQLLVNKLGSRSKPLAQGIYDANIDDFSRALTLIWETLDEIFGRPELLEITIRKQLDDFPVLTNSRTDSEKLYQLLNMLHRIHSMKLSPQYTQVLAYYDSSVGINPIISKIPYSLQEKWISRASSFKYTNNATYPPFSYFVDFIAEMCR